VANNVTKTLNEPLKSVENLANIPKYLRIFAGFKTPQIFKRFSNTSTKPDVF
jgi:hypothetical protein